MTATTVFVRSEPASEAVGLVVGSILLLFGLAQIFMVIRHWHWMQKSRWWKGAWRLRPGSRGIPMGRLGHSYVGTTWVIVGTFVIAGSQKIWPIDMRDYIAIAIGFVLWSIVGVVLFLRDYFRHLDKQDG